MDIDNILPHSQQSLLVEEIYTDHPKLNFKSNYFSILQFHITHEESER